MVRTDLRRRQRRAVLQPGDLGLCGAAVETPGVLQQHVLQHTGESAVSSPARPLTYTCRVSFIVPEEKPTCLLRLCRFSV